MKISREEFEKIFRRTNASWSYEDAELNDEEKESIIRGIREVGSRHSRFPRISLLFFLK